MQSDMIQYVILNRLLTYHIQFAHVPSAFQFRLGGYKGVLAVDPEAEGRTGALRDLLAVLNLQFWLDLHNGNSPRITIR
jgi:RNA dependent RNA polymerase